MASRTSFLAMREYPFSLKNFVNKFVEQKVKLAFMDKGTFYLLLSDEKLTYVYHFICELYLALRRSLCYYVIQLI